MGTKLYDDPAGEAHIWKVREAGLGATAFIPGKPDTHEGWEDSAVPPERLGEYLRELKELADRYGYESALYGHYGQGCVHARWNFDLATVERRRHLAPVPRRGRRPRPLARRLALGRARRRPVAGRAPAEDVRRRARRGVPRVQGDLGSRRTDEPGQGRRPVPDRLEPPLRPRLPAAARRRPTSPTRDDGGSFAHATTRCVGIGNCRRTKGGVMCPSYMVTREEKHSTRGRAHLLWEMLNGERARALALARRCCDALDLCLSCKGCTNDCPVNVDMPTLKAEFLAHHYARRLRPRQAYAFGLIDRWARLASRAPGPREPAHPDARARGRSRRRRRASRQQRRLPPFAPTSCTAWLRPRSRRRRTARGVILWPDTFTNHFEPEVGAAAVDGCSTAPASA